MTGQFFLHRQTFRYQGGKSYEKSKIFIHDNSSFQHYHHKQHTFYIENRCTRGSNSKPYLSIIRTWAIHTSANPKRRLKYPVHNRQTWYRFTIPFRFSRCQKTGKAFVTVTADGLHAKCQIRVIRPTITLSRKKLTIKAGKNKLLKTFVSSGYHPVFRSNNKRVATVNDLGRIYAKKKGTAKISVSFDGVKKICNVTVK